MGRAVDEDEVPTALLDPTARASDPPDTAYLEEGERIAGRYVVEVLLGAGGFGEVYRVRDERGDGTALALKVHRFGRSQPFARQAMTTEFGLLASMSHPNLASVHDFGWVGPDVTYFTQDLVHGVRLDAIGFALESPPMVELLAQLCRALEYLHDRGVLHRDIKPPNVLVDVERNHLTLLDFGIAHTMRHPQRAAISGGTCAYMAPEVVLGGLVDGRADLYSLGVTLHRLAADALPFRGPPEDILRQHIEARPPSLEGTVSPSMAELIGRLLAKHPSDRPTSAAALIRELSEATGVPLLPETVETLASYVLSAPLVGRADLLEALDDGAPDGGRFAVCVGDSGMGKSRLLREIRQRWQLRRRAWVGVSAYRGSAGRSLMVDLAWAVLDPPTLASLTEDDRIELARALPELRRKREHIAVPIDPERASRDRRAALARAIAHRFASREAAIAIEDLHFASPETCRRVGEVLREASCEGAQILVLGTARPGPCAEAFASATDASVLSMTNLSPEQSSELLGATLGSAISSELMRSSLGARVRREGCSPLWLQESLRLALEEGALARGDGQWQLLAEVGHLALDQVLGRRVECLPAEAQQITNALAVLGEPASAHDLAELTGLSVNLLAVVLVAAVRSGMVEPIRDGQGTTTYVMHDRYVDVILSRTEPAERQRLHGRAARLCSRRGHRDFRAMERAAGHLSASGDAHAASLALSRASTLAERAGKPGDARRLLERHLSELAACGGEPDAQTLLRLYDLQSLEGRSEEATATLERLQSSRLDAAAEMAVETRRAARELAAGEVSAARVRLEKVIPTADRAGLRSSQVYARLLHGRVEQEFGSQTLAGDLFSQAATMASEAGDRLSSVRGWIEASRTASLRGDARAAVELASRAAAEARRIPDPALRSEMRRALGNAHREAGHRRRAYREYERAVTWARRGGALELEAAALNNLAITAHQLMRIGEAREAHERAIGIKSRSGSHLSVLVSRNNLGAMLMAAGDYHGAEEQLHRVVAESETAAGHVACNATACLGEIALSTGLLAEARMLFDKSLAFAGERELGQLEGFPLHGAVRTRISLGQLDEAMALMHRLSKLAERVPQEATRSHLARAALHDALREPEAMRIEAEAAYAVRSGARYRWGITGSALETEWMLAIARARSGDRARARRVAARARRTLLRLARSIDSADARTRFLTVPPLHRAIETGDLEVPRGSTWTPGGPSRAVDTE